MGEETKEGKKVKKADIFGIPDFDCPISGACVYQSISPPFHTADGIGVVREAELAAGAKNKTKQERRIQSQEQSH